MLHLGLIDRYLLEKGRERETNFNYCPSVGSSNYLLEWKLYDFYFYFSTKPVKYIHSKEFPLDPYYLLETMFTEIVDPFTSGNDFYHGISILLGKLARENGMSPDTYSPSHG